MNKYVGKPIPASDDIKVVVNNAGEAMPSSYILSTGDELLAKGDMKSLEDLIPSIIFVRDDGWMLAAPPKFEHVAYAIWKDKWAGFLRYPDEIVEDIADYVPEEYHGD